VCYNIEVTYYCVSVDEEEYNVYSVEVFQRWTLRDRKLTPWNAGWMGVLKWLGWARNKALQEVCFDLAALQEILRD